MLEIQVPVRALRKGDVFCQNSTYEFEVTVPLQGDILRCQNLSTGDETEWVFVSPEHPVTLVASAGDVADRVAAALARFDPEVVRRVLTEFCSRCGSRGCNCSPAG